MIRVEVRGQLGLGDLFELIPAVEHQRAGSRPDGEGTRPKREQLVVVAVAVGIAVLRGHVEPAQLGIRLKRGIGKRGRIEDQAAHAGGFKTAGVAFIGHHEKRVRSIVVGGHSVRLVHSEHRPCRDVIGAVGIAGIQSAASHGVILEAEARELRDCGALDIHDSERVVLLQGDPGGFGIVRHGDVLRLQVLGHSRTGGIARPGPDDADRRIEGRVVESREAGRGDIRVGQIHCADRHVDDANRSFRIDAAARFALVGDQQPPAVRREGDHVGERAHSHRAERTAGGVEELNGARIGDDRVLHRHRHHAVADGHTIRIAAERDAADRSWRSGIRQVEDDDRVGGKVRAEKPPGRRIVRADLRRAVIEDAGRVCPNRLEPDLRVSGKN